MRIAMLTYSTRARGGVVHALKLAERLHNLGMNIRLYSLARDDDPAAMNGYFRDIDVPFEIIPYRWREDLIERLESMIDAYTSNLPKDAEIYHAQDCVGGTALMRMKERGIISAPVFRTVHHIDDFAEPRLFEFEKRAVANADHRFVVSRYWKDSLKRDYGYESIISYNGLDISDFQPLPPRKSTVPTVLFIGGLEPRKGLEHLYLAMEKVNKRYPQARLVAVAKSGFRGVDNADWFHTLADRIGMGDRFTVIPSVGEDELLQLYADSDVVVLPSRNEGWGLSIMEAMACAKPVVATNVGGIPELVRNEVDGILVEPGDVAAMADAITKILSDPDLSARFGRSGHERVKEFSWDSTAEVVRKAYERAI